MHVNDYLIVIRFAIIRIAVAAPDALGIAVLGSPLIHGSFDVHIIVCWHLRCVSFSMSIRAVRSLKMTSRSYFIYFIAS